MGRRYIRKVTELQRVLGGGSALFSRVTTAASTARTLELKPQGTTNPGTKALPKIYFYKAKGVHGFNDFRKLYPGSAYVMVPGNSTHAKNINPEAGRAEEYILNGSLPADDTQYVIEVGEDFFEEEESSSSKPSAPADKGWLDYCTIM